MIFQPFKEEPAPDFKCKDKFLVQTAVVKPDWVDWNMVELVRRERVEGVTEKDKKRFVIG